MGSDFTGDRRTEAFYLAGKALWAIGDRERKDPSREASLRAARTCAEGCRLAFSGKGQPGLPEVEEALSGYFRGDPLEWNEGFELVKELEAYRCWEEFGAVGTARCRHRYDGVRWNHNSLPELYRLIGTDGSERHVSVLPRTPAGLSEVWVPSVESMGTVGASSFGAVNQVKACWHRVFWCPVARAWKKNTVAEQLERSRRGVCAYLRRQLDEERNDATSVLSTLEFFDRKIDTLARFHYEPRKYALRGKWSELFERVNESLDRLEPIQERSFRRRAYIRPAFDRLRKIEELLAEIRQGNPVDITAVRGVDWTEVYTGNIDEEEATLRALSTFDPGTIRHALEWSQTRKHRDSEKVVAAVVRLTNELELAGVRKLARKLLDAWNVNPP